MSYLSYPGQVKTNTTKTPRKLYTVAPSKTKLLTREAFLKKAFEVSWTFNFTAQILQRTTFLNAQLCFISEQWEQDRSGSRRSTLDLYFLSFKNSFSAKFSIKWGNLHNAVNTVKIKYIIFETSFHVAQADLELNWILCMCVCVRTAWALSSTQLESAEEMLLSDGPVGKPTRHLLD